MTLRQREVFPSLLGNEKLKTNLSSDFASGKSAHAYIIAGPAGSGKRTVARLIAQSVLCENRNDPSHPLPCGVCPICKKTESGRCVDVLTLSNGDRATIGVDKIRELKQTLYLAPNDGDKKIYIIENAHRMTPQAQNSLLLSLEEPPKYAMFLLLTEDVSALLDTVRSRAPTIKTELFSPEVISDYLSKMPGLTPAQIERIPAASHLCGGSLGEAIELLRGGNSKFDLYKSAEEFTNLLLNGKKTDALAFVNTSMPKEREKTCELLSLVRLAVRDMISAKKDGELLFFDTPPTYARRISVRRLILLCEAVARAENDIAANGSQGTILTALCIE